MEIVHDDRPCMCLGVRRAWNLMNCLALPGTCCPAVPVASCLDRSAGYRMALPVTCSSSLQGKYVQLCQSHFLSLACDSLSGYAFNMTSYTGVVMNGSAMHEINCITNIRSKWNKEFFNLNDNITTTILSLLMFH